MDRILRLLTRHQDTCHKWTCDQWCVNGANNRLTVATVDQEEYSNDDHTDWERRRRDDVMCPVDRMRACQRTIQRVWLLTGEITCHPPMFKWASEREDNLVLIGTPTRRFVSNSKSFENHTDTVSRFGVTRISKESHTEISTQAVCLVQWKRFKLILAFGVAGCCCLQQKACR